MGQTRGQLKSVVRTNLADLGVTFYSDDDLNDSFQDAYDDIAAIACCVVKHTTLAFESNLSYYDLFNFGVSDYIGTIAIFNYISNLWLRDDLNLKDFDRIRRDWEKWEGTPQFWAPSDPRRIAICPKVTGGAAGGAFSSVAFTNAYYINSAGLGTFELYYGAQAPTLTSDSSTFQVATDEQTLLEYYVTADMLEQAQEFSKAKIFWDKYYPNIYEYKARVKANCQADLLLRI